MAAARHQRRSRGWARRCRDRRAANRIYWANYGSDTIAYANLSGGGGGQLNTSGATVNGPFGLAHRLLRGPDLLGQLRRQHDRLGQPGRGRRSQFNTTGATADGVAFPVLLRATAQLRAPNGPGRAQTGIDPHLLSGNMGDRIEPNRSSPSRPQSFSYQWFRNGKAEAGATSSSLDGQQGRHLQLRRHRHQLRRLGKRRERDRLLRQRHSRLQEGHLQPQEGHRHAAGRASPARAGSTSTARASPTPSANTRSGTAKITVRDQRQSADQAAQHRQGEGQGDGSPTRPKAARRSSASRRSC